MDEQLFILGPTDAEQIIAYEKGRLSAADPMEQEMASWHAKWRQESLNHHLPLGWSFGFKQTINGESKLAGYFIGQPLLFFRGLTQTLWVEHIAFDSEEIGLKLIETAYRWAKDKHLQMVLFSDSKNLEFAKIHFPQLKLADDIFLEMKSARF